MDKLLKDSEGNIFKAQIVSDIPKGFEDISDLEIPEELLNEEAKYLQCIEGVISKKSSADVDRRNAILKQLRDLRQPFLDAADILVNKKEDLAEDSSAERAYRVALKEVPQSYIKLDGDPKISVDAIDLENFIWPTKPV